MQIPTISENSIHTLLNQLEHGFDYSVTKSVEKIINRGLYSMELLLGMGEDEEDYEMSFRREVKDDWIHKTKNKSLSTQMTIKEKIILYLIYALTALTIIATIALFWFGAIERFNVYIDSFFVSAINVVVFVFCPVPVLIYKSIKSKKYNASISSDLEHAQANLRESDLIEFAETVYCDSITKHVKNICKQAGIDPNDAKVDLGKASGGGSRFYGMGSGAMVATGIGLTIISTLKASSKNSEINKRVKEIEEYLFYNNVASIFNSNM